MTTKLNKIKTPATNTVRLPDPRPCDLDMSTFYYVNYPAYPAALNNHFGSSETTIISSEMGGSVRPTEIYEDVRFPDLLVAFGVDRAAHVARNGYVIEEQGKPPDFVLEVASPSNARNDETVKREYYARMAVAEYWRFDQTGGELYRSGLEGDILVDGRYQPIPINRTENGQLWGHSTALGLDLCWQEGRLRWWDPVGQRYLRTYDESEARNRELVLDRTAEREGRLAAEVRAAASDARATASDARATASDARATASDARVRELEAELRRRDQA